MRQKGMAIGALVVLVGVIWWLTRCTSDCIELPIAQYHELGLPPALPPVDSAVDTYLDYSLGMGEGMTATARINDELKGFLQGRQVTYYRVGAEEVPSILNIDAKESNFLDAANYQERGSKLKAVLDSIVAHEGRVSVFITDFERILPYTAQLPGAPRPHPIDASAWAQVAFRTWLQRGHRLDVFAHRYEKPDAWFGRNSADRNVNWIYTLVFTPREVARDDKALASSVLGFMLNVHKRDGGADYRHLAYWADAIGVEAMDGTAVQATINPDIAEEDGAVGVSFERHTFLAKELLRLRADDNLPDKRILMGLRLRSSVDFLDSVRFDLRVTDVTAPLDSLNRLINLPPPDTTFDEGTGAVKQVTNPAVPLVALPGVPASDVFEFVLNPQTMEMGVSLASAFSGVRTETTYRVDVVVAEVVSKTPADADEILSLSYAGGYRIRALGESLKLATQDVARSIEGRILHTLYITIAP